MAPRFKDKKTVDPINAMHRLSNTKAPYQRFTLLQTSKETTTNTDEDWLEALSPINEQVFQVKRQSKVARSNTKLNKRQS